MCNTGSYFFLQYRSLTISDSTTTFPRIFVPGAFPNLKEMSLSPQAFRQANVGVAILRGRLGGSGIDRLTIPRWSGVYPSDLFLFGIFASSTSSIHNIRSLTITSSDMGPIDARLLGSTLFKRGVFPRLESLKLKLWYRHDNLASFIQGSMEADAAAVQLKSLAVEVPSSHELECDGLFAAMARGPNEPFSKLRALEVYANTSSIQALLEAAEDARAGKCAHDWASSITGLGVATYGKGVIPALSESLEKGVFPELKRLWSKEAGTPFRVLKALETSHDQGRRKYRVTWE